MPLCIHPTGSVTVGCQDNNTSSWETVQCRMVVTSDRLPTGCRARSAEGDVFSTPMRLIALRES